MQKQATWYGPDFFPDVKANPGSATIYPVGTDIGLFYFPPIDPVYGTPALGAGDACWLSLRPMVLPSPTAPRRSPSSWPLPQGMQRWIEAGSAICANQTTPADWYAGNYKLSVASNIVANSTCFGFDASDLMPASVGRLRNGSGSAVDRERRDKPHRHAVLQQSTPPGRRLHRQPD